MKKNKIFEKELDKLSDKYSDIDSNKENDAKFLAELLTIIDNCDLDVKRKEDFKSILEESKNENIIYVLMKILMKL